MHWQTIGNFTFQKMVLSMLRRRALMAAGFMCLTSFAPQAMAQGPCCSITAISQQTGIVTAKVNATGQVFEFKVTNPALLRSLKVGEAIYANFKTRQVSVDGKTPCGTIVSLGPAKGPLPPAAPSKAPSPSPAPPGTSPRAAGGSTPQAGPVAPTAGTSPACCGITSVDARARLAAAKVNSTGQNFEFSVPNSVPIQNLHAGQPVWANFKARKVSLDGRIACCDIVSLAASSPSQGIGPSPPLETASAAGTKSVGQVQGSPPPAAASNTANLTAGGTTAQIKGGTGSAAAPAVASIGTAAGSKTPPGGARAHLLIPIGSISLSQSSVIGGTSISGMVTLKSPAGGLPVQITLVSSDPAANVVPPQLEIPAGESSSHFTVNTSPISADPDAPPQGVSLYIEGSTPNQEVLASAGLVVLTPTLAGLTLSLQDPCTAGVSQLEIVGRYQVQGCLQLTGPAPQDGIPVALANDYPDLVGSNFPSSVTVPAGSATATFTFSTSKVSASTAIQISASRSAGNYKNATLTLDPPPAFTSVYLDPSSLQYTPCSFDGLYWEYYAINAYLIFSAPPDPSQGDPGSANLNLSGHMAFSFGSPNDYCRLGPTSEIVSVTSMSKVQIPVYLWDGPSASPCSLSVTWDGTTKTVSYSNSALNPNVCP